MAAVLAAGILLTTTAMRSDTQTPAVGPVWEYATVTGQPSVNDYTLDRTATICYASVNGCRNEQVLMEKEGMNFPAATMAAAAKLGEKGWELTAMVNSATSRVMYFKRLRSAINKREAEERR